VKGDFAVGDPATCLDVEGNAQAKGLVNYATPDVRKIMGEDFKSAVRSSAADGRVNIRKPSKQVIPAPRKLLTLQRYRCIDHQ
jgi:hypothetical protein